MLKREGAIVSVLDRPGREDVRLHQPRCANASAVGLQGYVDHTLPSLLCIIMILRVRRNFFEIATFPNSCFVVQPIKIFVEYVGANMGIKVPLLVIDRRRVSVMSTWFSNP